MKLKLSELNVLSRYRPKRTRRRKAKKGNIVKKAKGLWQKALRTENSVKAVVDGTKYKRGDRAVQKLLYDDEMVEQHPNLYHLIDKNKAVGYVTPLIENLRNHTWKHGRPKYRRQFCKNKASNGGKWRDLYIPQLDDHIIAHIIMEPCKEVFMRGMHPFCCGSVPGRGIKTIVKQVDHWMKDDKECRYFVKLDIVHFFDNINGDILMQKLRDKIKDPDILWGHQQIIESAPLACPVGYFTSPWYANLYLEKLDWHIVQDLFKERRGKRIPYVRHYLRYMDDMLLIGTSKSDLEKAVKEIKRYLWDELGLEIKPTWEIKAIGKHEYVDGKWKLKKGTYWCDMGGYKFCKDATVMRDRIYLSAKHTSRRIFREERYTIYRCQSINAKIGWAKHADSYQFIQNEIKPYVNIKLTRRIISDVDKNRKQRTGKTGRSSCIRRQSYTQPQLQTG